MRSRDFDFSSIPMELYAANESKVHALLAENITGQVGTEFTYSSPTGTSFSTGIPIKVEENALSIATLCRFA